MKKMAACSALALSALVCSFTLSAAVLAAENAPLLDAVKKEEATLQARIGMTVLDTGTNSRWQYRGDERFPINSTHKVFACAALLHKADKQQVSMSKRVSFDKANLVTYSPVTEKHVAPDTMSLDDLCQAAVSNSDNTAANLVFNEIGGPQALTLYMQSIGDKKTRLNRTEPSLNEATPGDLRDTTTPNAITASLNKLVLGKALSTSSRAKLGQWMQDDKVADALLRSVLPKDWKIADKTGAGGFGSRSIVAVVWPAEDKKPLVVSIYITQTKASLADSNKAIARLGDVLFKNYQ
jgi:beta-lactamase class A